jgi:biotin carboxyl carrier protein
VDLVVKHRDREARVRLERTEGGYRVDVDGATYEVDAVHVDGGVRSLLIGGRQFVVSVRCRGNGRYLVSHAAGSGEVELMDPLAYMAMKAHGAGRGGGVEPVKAYMPGRVVRILVEEGQEVAAGQGIVVLEAMKMENEIQAEHGGTVRKIHVAAGEAVEGGDVLFEMG